MINNFNEGNQLIRSLILSAIAAVLVPVLLGPLAGVEVELSNVAALAVVFVVTFAASAIAATGNGGNAQGDSQSFNGTAVETVDENDDREQGTVKWFNVSKGFGFITPDEGGNDVFVHITAVKDSGMADLRDGQRVSFETEPDKRGKGPKAVNLQTSE